ncbi:unnamed protein product [Adineta ricciae]|uniref:Uncharacterized protein n=1 Tax=Adineta ricciae TaxID=249248 RepID=A0A813S4K0_ADIRI|nr:unnamed protein product [Adineta ricciae]CAF1252214.1 unnamed protein product [Adineta ricciae]
MALEQAIKRESERFQALFNRLSDTQWSDTGIVEAKTYLADCQNYARITQDKITEFNTAAEREHKRLLAIKGHGLRHVWYKVQGKLEERLGEQEKVWLKEFEKCKQEEEHLIELKKEIHSAAKYLHECQITHDEFVKTKRMLDEMLEHFFSGETPSYPDEDFMEQNLKKQQEQLTSLQTQHRLLTNVFQLLHSAHQSIIIARHALHDAIKMNTFDLAAKSSFADMAANSNLARARNATIRAQDLIDEAKRVSPNIRHIADLRIRQDNLVFNLMFDNIWTDLNMRFRIGEALQRLSRADTLIMDTSIVVKEQLSRCEIDRNKKSEDVKRLAVEHFTARITIVKNILEPSISNTSVV